MWEIDKVIKAPVVLFWVASIQQGVLIVAERLELYHSDTGHKDPSSLSVWQHVVCNKSPSCKSMHGTVGRDKGRVLGVFALK